MSLTVPAVFQWPEDAAAEGIAHDATIRRNQIKALCESGHFARARLRTFAAWGGESIQTTSGGYIDAFDELAITASASDRARVLVDVYCHRTTIKVTITDGSSSVNSSASMSGTGTISLEINAGSLSASDDWTIQLEFKRTSGTATIYAGSIREKPHDAGSIT
tara:strand:- start:1018 stop:1506 length:489 start_codon:yes stop_codon:yes gene_type:complete